MYFANYLIPSRSGDESRMCHEVNIQNTKQELISLTRNILNVK